MRVTVNLHSTLRKFLPAGASGATVLDLKDGASAADVITQLGIPPAYTNIVVCAGQQIDPTSVLRDGQYLDLFPPLSGGR